MMRPSWMPSIGDIIFVLILQLFFVLMPNFIFGDGSTGWHLVTGHYVLDHWQIPRSDLISYTFPDKAWVAYEWLFDVFIALLDKIAGLKLVAVACCSLISLLFLLLYEDCRRKGCHFIPAMLLCIMGALISAIHWLARPHLVTFFGLFIYTRYLLEFYDGKITARKLNLILAGTMLVWVNCHPAFLMGIVVLGIYLVSDLLICLCSASGEAKSSSAGRARSLFLTGLIVVAVTFVNPYGIELYKYIVEYLQQSVVISQTDEYSSPVFHGQLQTVLLELLYFALALGLVCTQKKPSLPALLTVLAYAHLSLAGKRNMPLFVIVSLPFIASLFAQAKFSSFISRASAAASSWILALKGIWDSAGKTVDEMEFSCTRHALPILAVLLLAVSCFSNGKALGFVLVKSGFDEKNKPTQTLECLTANKLEEKQGITFDNWGGYIKYKTGMRVFIDDRVDFYGQKFYLDYADIATGQSNWREVLDRYKINWVLFPNNSVLVSNLKLESSWKLLCEDKASCLYVRAVPK